MLEEGGHRLDRGRPHLPQCPVRPGEQRTAERLDERRDRLGAPDVAQRGHRALLNTRVAVPQRTDERVSDRLILCSPQAAHRGRPHARHRVSRQRGQCDPDPGVRSHVLAPAKEARQPLPYSNPDRRMVVSRSTQESPNHIIPLTPLQGMRSSQPDPRVTVSEGQDQRPDLLAGRAQSPDGPLPEKGVLVVDGDGKEVPGLSPPGGSDRLHRFPDDLLVGVLGRLDQGAHCRGAPQPAEG